MRRAAIAVVLTVGAVVAPAAAAPAPPPPGTKKAAYLDDKRPSPARRVRAKAAVGKPAAPIINLRNLWTEEWLPVDADPRRPVPADALRDRFLRDHYTNGPTQMDARLIATLREAARHFNARRVDIVSGFRAPKYNLMLRKKGHEVARDSQHTHGNAVDFRIPGVTVDELHAWAVAKKLGGVGLYRGSKFVHMDTGRIRYWGGD